VSPQSKSKAGASQMNGFSAAFQFLRETPAGTGRIDCFTGDESCAAGAFT